MPSHKHRDEVEIEDWIYLSTLPFQIGVMPFSALGGGSILALFCLCFGCCTLPLGVLASVLLFPICLCIGLVEYIRAAILDRRDSKRAQLQHSGDRVICVHPIESLPPPVIYTASLPYNPQQDRLQPLQPQPVPPPLYTHETPRDPGFSLV